MASMDDISNFHTDLCSHLKSLDYNIKIIKLNSYNNVLYYNSLVPSNGEWVKLYSGIDKIPIFQLISNDNV